MVQLAFRSHPAAIAAVRERRHPAPAPVRRRHAGTDGRGLQRARLAHAAGRRWNELRLLAGGNRQRQPRQRQFPAVLDRQAATHRGQGRGCVQRHVPIEGAVERAGGDRIPRAAAEVRATRAEARLTHR